MTLCWLHVVLIYFCCFCRTINTFFFLYIDKYIVIYVVRNKSDINQRVGYFVLNFLLVDGDSLRKPDDITSEYQACLAQFKPGESYSLEDVQKMSTFSSQLERYRSGKSVLFKDIIQNFMFMVTQLEVLILP